MPTHCICPGFNLTYECTTAMSDAGGATVWTGTAFDCPETEDQLTFVHIRDRFNDTYRGCSGGAISGRGLRVEESGYTSQVNITVDDYMDGRSVECFYVNDMGKTLLANYSIMVTSGIHIRTIKLH